MGPASCSHLCNEGFTLLKPPAARLEILVGRIWVVVQVLKSLIGKLSCGDEGGSSRVGEGLTMLLLLSLFIM